MEHFSANIRQVLNASGIKISKMANEVYDPDIDLNEEAFRRKIARYISGTNKNVDIGIARRLCKFLDVGFHFVSVTNPHIFKLSWNEDRTLENLSVNMRLLMRRKGLSCFYDLMILNPKHSIMAHSSFDGKITVSASAKHIDRVIDMTESATMMDIILILDCVQKICPAIDMGDLTSGNHGEFMELFLSST